MKPNTLKNIFIGIKTSIIGLAIIGIVLHGWYERGDYDVIGLAALLLGVLFLFSKDTVLTGAKKIFDAILASIGGGGGGGSDNDKWNQNNSNNNFIIKFDRNKKR